MNNPKVSVIIPVYNTEAYVEQTLRSIMGQTLRDIELIVINDGSTDGSLSALELIATGDDRIRLYTQPNKGLSQTRNAGIDRARGEFIYFMDSDDLLEPDALERCYERCQSDRLDFVFFDAESFGAAASDAAWFDYRRAKYFGTEVCDGTDLLRRMLALHCYRASACLSFIRTAYLRGLGLRFYPGILHEDELFTPQLYLGATRAGGIERSFFKRRIHGDSIMGRGFSRRNLEGYTTVLRELNRFAAPVLVALDGRCGSGKTTLAAQLAQQFPQSITVHTDDFYLPPASRVANWEQIPCANMDLERLRAQVLTPARAGQAIPYRAYSCRAGAYLPEQCFAPQPLVIVEDSYSCHPTLADCYDLKVFVTCSKEEQARRLLAREGERYSGFTARWIPLEEGYFAKFQIEQTVDFILDTTC